MKAAVSPFEKAQRLVQENRMSIAVLGSLNVDFVTQMDRFPSPGETVTARSFAQFAGGKGANQAAACGRLGTGVKLFGAVGRDHFSWTGFPQSVSGSSRPMNMNCGHSRGFPLPRRRRSKGPVVFCCEGHMPAPCFARPAGEGRISIRETAFALFRDILWPASTPRRPRGCA